MEFNPQTTKKPTRSFFSAASVFTKKIRTWRQNQKLKKQRRTGIGDGSAASPVENSIGKKQRDIYSRRSCDRDPRFPIDAGRFSLDAGRVSVDDPRYSFDKPRASWDGNFINRTAAPPRMASMLSAVEDSPVIRHVLRPDTHTPVNSPPPPPPEVDYEIIPGGSAQTREYYSDTFSRRRKSLDRSNSTRKISASVMAEIDSASHTNRDAKDSNSLRDEEKDFKMCVRENIGTMESSKKGTKESRRWKWNVFGFIHPKKESKHEEERGRNGVDRTFSGSWNVETRKVFDPKIMRSNSSVSWRSSGTKGELRRNSVDGYLSGKKKISI